MKPAVRFEQVSKRYRLGVGRASLRETLVRPFHRLFASGEVGVKNPFLWAIRDLDFELPAGHALGLVGPNGSGKTTVLKLLANITKPTTGRVEVCGRVAALIELGAGFHPDLTGRDNIYLNGAILGLSKKEVDMLFDRIVSFSGLEPFIDTPVKRYSSGMYVRLGFSIAAHVESDVLLVDEVLAVGDAQFRHKCSERIEALRKKGTTIVFVAHNLFLVKSVCDVGMFLEKGRVAAQGDIGEVIQTYERWLHGQQVAEALAARETAKDGLAKSAAELERIEVVKTDGRVASSFQHHEPAEVRVHFAAKKPIRQSNIVVRIQRADGLTCAMIRTRDYGFELPELAGTGYVSILIDPLQLSGGAYSLEARIIGAVDGVPLAVGTSPWFEVTGPSLSHEQVSGVFVCRIAAVEVESQDHSQSQRSIVPGAALK